MTPADQSRRTGIPERGGICVVRTSEGGANIPRGPDSTPSSSIREPCLDDAMVTTLQNPSILKLPLTIPDTVVGYVSARTEMHLRQWKLHPHDDLC